MGFLGTPGYVVVVAMHVIASAIAVGAVAVTDYFHLIGLKSKTIEKKLMFIYPLLSKMIQTMLLFIVGTGVVLVMNNPTLLSSPLFQLKMTLFVVVAINGSILHHFLFPRIEKCVIKGKRHCAPGLVHSTALYGSISFVTWFAILLLALTKELAYTVVQFLLIYFGAIAAVFIVSMIIEHRAHIERIK